MEGAVWGPEGAVLGMVRRGPLGEGAVRDLLNQGSIIQLSVEDTPDRRKKEEISEGVGDFFSSPDLVFGKKRNFNLDLAVSS